jgi:lipoprotein-anchoring transpeptidase ErfK/SrfK
MAAVYTSDEMMVAAFPITPGKPQFIPVGTWKVQSMMTTPSFRYDKQFLEEGVRGEEAFQLPPGPNSPIGIIWCGLSKSGIGLHGTALPRTIGRTRSAGCVRLANWDAIRLPTLIRPGTKVIVR